MGSGDGSVASVHHHGESTPTAVIDFKQIASRVDYLERSLSQQTKTSATMLKVLRTITKMANSMGKSISEVIAEKQYLNSLTDPPINMVCCTQFV